MFKKITAFATDSNLVEVVKKFEELPEALSVYEVAGNTEPEIIRLKLKMMEELILKGLDMEAIERILHIKRRKDA